MKLYDENKKISELDIFKWLHLYWEGIRENSFLWKIIVVVLAIASSAAAIMPFSDVMAASKAVMCAGFLALCTIVLFLPFRSPVRSFHWDYRCVFISIYGYMIYRTVNTLLYMIEGDSAEFQNYWSMYWFINFLAFGAVLQLNLLIHKLYAKKDRRVLKLYEMMIKYSLFSRIKVKNERKAKKYTIINTSLFMIGITLFTASKYLDRNFSAMDMDTIFFTIRFANGSYSSDVRNAIILMAAAVILVALLFMIMVYRREKADVLLSRSPDRKQSLEMKISYSPKWIVYLLSCGVFVCGMSRICDSLDLLTFIKRNLTVSSIYEEHYAAPTQDIIHFPDKKKNLVYIYMESFENTYTSFEHGGNQPKDLIPEVYELEKENINFSNGSGVGGQSVFFPLIMYTMGSTVAQTSGVPLTSVLKLEHNNMAAKMSSMLGSLRRLEDVLHDEGYNQLFIRGENTNFAGYNTYVGRYDNSKVYDVKNAMADGKVPENYIHPWGLQDSLLFPLVKEHIDELAAQDAPFCVSMYTVDTHSVEKGMRCELCDPKIKNDFAAAINCSSRQTADLIKWLSEKPYWEDTVVIIVGDHLSELCIDGVRFDDDGYLRTTCNCIINSQKVPVYEKNRTFCAMDMFPTTLSAIGCTIDGDRLGLGTDLFSDTPTLCEEMGADIFVEEIQKKSEFYDENFIGKK
ncbi:MAG: LTA synthase family protein [Ruminococcus sp.]|uniref:LTA synthase family protein n=1 Tax=Ruminococcus sp. TaxID=41978 RepID=UPI0025DAEFD1|nr:LTA synthase family protein [Ruminococcus sp.]MCR5600103.1 LTA synthase family protein [Ruminococcus sp.]